MDRSDSRRLLEGRTVIVTGAARGIGRAVAASCAREGAALVLVDSGADVAGAGCDPEVVEAAAEDIRKLGASVEAIAVDVAAPGAIEHIFERASTSAGRLHGVVHAAGGWVEHPASRTPAEALERVLAVKLGAAFRLTSVAARAMTKDGRGGSIVLVAGLSAFFGARGQAAMGAAEAGLVALARSAALELRRHDIRVNVVCPTARTRQTEALPTFAALPPSSMTPEHVASVATFLLSDLASQVHGEIVGVAGARVYTIRTVETAGHFGPAEPLDPRAVAEAWPDVVRS